LSTGASKPIKLCPINLSALFIKGMSVSGFV
jgi:hypothetical protein